MPLVFLAYYLFHQVHLLCFSSLLASFFYLFAKGFTDVLHCFLKSSKYLDNHSFKFCQTYYLYPFHLGLLLQFGSILSFGTHSFVSSFCLFASVSVLGRSVMSLGLKGNSLMKKRSCSVVSPVP